MPFVAAPNIVMVEWRYTVEGQRCENRMMVNHFGDPGATELAFYAQDAWDWWENDYSAHITDNVTLREVVTTDMSVQNGEQSTYAPDTTTAGLINTIALPNETSFCVSLRSSVRGRSARGRWFVVGIPVAARTGVNNLSDAYAEFYRASLQAYIDAHEANNKRATIVSYITNGAPRVGGPVYFVIESAVIVDTILDSQRRRKPGVGN